MTFRIENIKSEINNSGIAHSGHFEVLISRPPGLPGDIVESRGLAFRTDSAALPARSLAAIDNYYDIGVTRNIPYTATHGDFAVSIICSEDMREKEFFDKWQDVIIGDYRSGYVHTGNQYNIGYYDDYVSTITVQRFAAFGAPTYSVRLLECYPRTINPINMDWGNSEVLRLNISFNYRYFVIDQATNSTRAAERANPVPTT